MSGRAEGFLWEASGRGWDQADRSTASFPAGEGPMTLFLQTHRQSRCLLLQTDVGANRMNTGRTSGPGWTAAVHQPPPPPPPSFVRHIVMCCRISAPPLSYCPTDSVCVWTTVYPTASIKDTVRVSFPLGPPMTFDFLPQA